MPERHALPFRLRWQADWCRRLGSPLYADLMLRAADDAEAGGPVAAVVEGHETDPLETMLQLRLMGAVHRLALSGRAPELAACYPSTGGHGRLEETWEAFRSTVETRMPEVREHVPRPVQTNEVGRSRVLACGFLAVTHRHRMPLRLLEVGASAGLNLRWDSFWYQAGELSLGDAMSPVRFTDFVVEGWPPPNAEVRISTRAGCDPNPVDLADEDGVLTLRSYVWADQLERLELLDGAIAAAAAAGVEVERADTVSWLDQRLAEPVPGECAVVFHSIVMQYVAEDERERISAAIAAAGRRATADAPLCRLAFEPGGEEAELRLITWPGGEERVLARAGYHGADVRWLG